MRLLYIVPPSSTFAGIERVVHELADQLCRGYGLDIHVLYCSRYMELAESAPAYTVHYINAPRLRNVYLPLRGFLAKNDYDLVICAQIELSLITWAALWPRKQRFAPYLHGNPIVEASGLWNGAIFFLFRMLAAPKAAAILCVSPSLADYASQALAGGRRAYHVPNPVREFDNTEPLKEPNQPFTFLNVGRLSRQKGQDILLRAYALARPVMPPSRLILVGGGTELEAVRGLILKLGLQEYVELTAKHTDPGPYYRRADCFVLSSRWEGFGVVLAEALSFGLPLIVSDCDFGPKDLVVDERIGLVTKAEDVHSLAMALRAMSGERSNPESETYRRQRAGMYSKTSVAKSHLRVLRHVCG